MKKLILLFALACSGCASMGRSPQGRLQETFVLHGDEIDSVLKAGGNVSLAIVVESINNPSVDVKKDVYTAWAKGIEDQLIAEYAQYFIGRYGKVQTFQLLDRNKVNKILDEYTFQYRGMTRAIDAEALGQFANATHLLIVTFTRFADTGTQTDAIQGRLVTVKEAKILSVNQYSYKR